MKHLERSTPSVIVSDIAMPSQDGFDLLRQVRALDDANADVPIVALTAFTSDDEGGWDAGTTNLN